MSEESEDSLLLKYAIAVVEEDLVKWIYLVILAGLVGYLYVQVGLHHEDPEAVRDFADAYMLLIYAPVAIAILRPALLVLLEEYGPSWLNDWEEVNQ